MAGKLPLGLSATYRAHATASVYNEVKEFGGVFNPGRPLSSHIHSLAGCHWLQNHVINDLAENGYDNPPVQIVLDQCLQQTADDVVEVVFEAMITRLLGVCAKCWDDSARNNGIGSINGTEPLGTALGTKFDDIFQAAWQALENSVPKKTPIVRPATASIKAGNKDDACTAFLDAVWS